MIIIRYGKIYNLLFYLYYLYRIIFIFKIKFFNELIFKLDTKLTKPYSKK